MSFSGLVLAPRALVLLRSHLGKPRIMFCRKCGTQNDDNANQCLNCGETLSQTPDKAGPPVYIPNYLVQSILVTLFCCIPLGVVAIILAAQVNGKIEIGDIPGAISSSKQAKKWTWIAFGAGLLHHVVVIILIIAFVIALQKNL